MTDQTLEEYLEELRPDWIEPGIDLTDIENIQYGGCASGAYMPAVTYYKAIQTMSVHGDDVLQYIEDNYGELPQPVKGESWGGLACFYLSLAVELWAGQFDTRELEQQFELEEAKV